MGLVAGAVVWDAPWQWGYWSYYNPYCTEVIVVDNAMIDYSQPIVLAAPPPGSLAIDPSVAENQAMQLLDASAMRSSEAIISARPWRRSTRPSPNSPATASCTNSEPDPVCHAAIQAGRGRDLRRAVGRPGLGLADAVRASTRT